MVRVRALAAIVFVASALWAHGAVAQTGAAQPSALTVEQWRADLRYLADQMPLHHKNLFHTMTPAAFAAAVAGLDADIPHLTADEITLRLIALATSPADSHTGVFGFPQGQSFPLRFRHYDDGIYVEAAPARYADAVGGRLLSIDKTSAETVFDELSAVVPHDPGNPGLLGLIGPVLMTMGHVLHGLDVTPTADSATYVVVKNGKRSTLDLTAGIETRTLFGYAPIPGWVDLRGAAAQPLWLQHADKTFWSAYDAATRTYYIQFNAVANTPDETVKHFFETTFGDVAAVRPDKLVLDLRMNGGGNNYLLTPIIVGLIRLPEIDRPGHLFVITSRSTYSAAQNLVNRLEQYTDAIFVGEPTGQHVNSYGDPVAITLPNSHLTVGMASVWWQDFDERDKRTETDPELAAPLTLADYVANRDPALAAIATYRPDRIEDDVLTGIRSSGVAGGVAAYRAYATNPLHGYVQATLERRVNALGYDLLGKHAFADAIAVFSVNVDANPTSANAQDSLGEAYADAGDRAKAIAAYQRAIKLNPALPSSRAALTRLGAPQL